MANSCVWMPNKGQKTFAQLRSNFDYSIAAEVFNKVRGSEFKEMFKSSLKLDEEGIPTYNSILNNPIIQDYIGMTQVIESFQKKQPVLPDVSENIELLINKATEFCKENPSLTAYVDYTKEGNLTLKIADITSGDAEILYNQKRILALNSTIARILAPAGITIGTLNELEVAAGRVGETNFIHAKDIADNFAGLLRVANNMEGTVAVSEEFAHLLVRINKNTSLIKRGLEFLKSHLSQTIDILGDQYSNVFRYYDGDMAKVAEEALGQMLQNALLEANNKKDAITKKVPLFKRILDFILKPFKGINPGNYQTAIDHLQDDLTKLASDYINGKKTITQEDIQATYDVSSFNALSEREQVQMDILKKSVENQYKLGALTQNLEERDGEFTEKYKIRKGADNLESQISSLAKEEETVAATAVFLDNAIDNLQDLFNQLDILETKGLQDRFIVLRNSLYTIQAYSETLKELGNTFTEEFFKDPKLSSQKFLTENISNDLAAAETSNIEEEAVDTSNMSIDEIIDLINMEANNWIVDKNDPKFYINKKTGEKALRVTKTIEGDKNATVFDPNSPWVIPSTNIGTGIDELVRDFFTGRITYDGNSWTVNGENLASIYPNASSEQLNKFCAQLQGLKNKFKEDGITIVPRNIVAQGITQTIDGTGKIHNIKTVGTLDLIGYDKNGKWHIYDMKTHRGEISNSKKLKWSRQLSLYKQFLQDKYGIKIEDISVIPIKVQYPTPKEAGGNSTYKVSTHKSPNYNGEESNQLIVNKEEYKDAKPFLEGLIKLHETKLNLSYKKLTGDTTNGFNNGKEAVMNALGIALRLYNQFEQKFYDKAFPEFATFLKEFIGSEIPVTIDGKVQNISVEQLLTQETTDISLMTKLFSTMADNPDILLQAFNSVYKQARTEYRENTIEFAQEIRALAKEYEDLGITDYDFMFEDSKRNYVQHLIINGKDISYDQSAYEKALKEEFDRLDEQYGKNLDVNSEEYSKKLKAQQQWIKNNTKNIYDRASNTWLSVPIKEKYPSKYDSFTETQKKFYEEWMDIKSRLDMKLGDGKTTLTNTIKIRKGGIERLSDAISNGKLTTYLEELRSKIKKSYDDDINYKTGIRGFEGEEVKKLPLFYLTAPDTADLSTDVISTLIAYAEMSCNYEAMNKIVNPLEIGKIIANKRGIIEKSQGKIIKESFTFAGHTINNPIYKQNSNIQQMLDFFFDSKIYNKYIQDSGETAGLDNNKLAGLVLKIGSSIQLGFNTFAHIANALTGIGTENIEAVCGEFFNARELAAADATFTAELADYVGDIGQRVNNSKLALFDELFDVRQNFKSKNNHARWVNRTILGRLFGPNIQFLGQDAGDFWLYNRVALAIAKKTKVLKNGEETSLWEALEVKPVKEGKDYGSKLSLEGITDLEGNTFSTKNIHEVASRIQFVNKHLFGVYSEEDMIMARSTILGRFVMQYRDWIPSAMIYRFRGKGYSMEKGDVFEGYYRTGGRFLYNVAKELKNGSGSIGQVWSQLDDYEKKNITRCVFELGQYFTVAMIAGMLHGAGSDKKKKRVWYQALLSYLASREKTELGSLTPIAMPTELLSILKSPFAATNVINSAAGLGQLLNPFAYTETMKSGEYKGHSKAYRAFMNSPLTLWYKNFKRFADPSKAENFYWNN